MEAASSEPTSVSTYQTTQYHSIIDKHQHMHFFNNFTVQRTAPQGSPRTPATCIAVTTPELMVGILNSVFFKFFKFLNIQ